MQDFTHRGYLYSGFTFGIVDESAYKEGPLGIRNYILAQKELQIFFKEDNRAPTDDGTYYAVKAELYDSPKKDSIGNLHVLQLNKNDEVMQRKSVAMLELDNSHAVDLVLGEVIDLHHRSFGIGPHGLSDFEVKHNPVQKTKSTPQKLKMPHP